MTMFHICLRILRYRDRTLCLLATLLLLLTLSIPAIAGPPRDVLYQISTIDALMAGLYDGSTSLAQLTQHGDFGLGTFHALDGEMVILDGVVYQITSEGTVLKPAADVATPFAAVTFFDNDTVVTIPNEMTITKLQEYLDGLLPSRNLFYAIRIDGTFERVRTRSVPRQSKPYPKLVDVTAQQPVFDLGKVTGTIVGFRCPYFVTGVNVPGYHMHLITSDRNRGGHLLDCSVKSGVITIDITPQFSLALPQDESFYRTEFAAGRPEDLEKVEKGKQ